MVNHPGQQVRGEPNRIDLPGTPEEAWESWLELWQLPAASPQAWPSVVVIAAHPDDEVLAVAARGGLPGRAGQRHHRPDVRPTPGAGAPRVQPPAPDPGPIAERAR